MFETAFISNAFSIQMIGKGFLDGDGINIEVKKIWQSEVEEILKNSLRIVSCVGHKDTAAVLSDILERDIPCNRTSIQINRSDVLVVFQITSGRLPEGATTIPDDVTFDFFEIRIGSDINHRDTSYFDNSGDLLSD